MGAAGVFYVHNSMHRPIPFDSTIYRIERGDNLSNFTQQLKISGLVTETWSFQLWARMKGDARRIKAGEYRFAADSSLADALQQLVDGSVVKRSITFIEGWTFYDVRAALQRNPYLTQTLDGTDDARVMHELGRPQEHPEGRFFPDTYVFNGGATDLSILQQAYQRMRRILADEWAERATDVPVKDSYQALILASIIEKETGRAEERARIGGVLCNRLKGNMRLQVDPTVIYGLGREFDGNLTRKHLLADNPYNTYTRAGLPPTPIAMPGIDAIRAALHPESTEALYFVARGDGSHEFSKTLRAHQLAVRKYQLKHTGQTASRTNQ